MANTKKQEVLFEQTVEDSLSKKEVVEWGNKIYTKIHQDKNSETYISNLPTGVVIMYISSIPNTVYVPNVRYSFEENRFERL